MFVFKRPTTLQKEGGGTGQMHLSEENFVQNVFDTEQALYWYIYPLLNEVTPNLKLKTPLTKDVYTKNAYLDRKNKSMKRTSTDIVIMKVLKM